MKPILIVSLAVLMTGIALVGCERAAPKARRGETRERLPRVEVIKPVMKPLARRLELAATVEALKKVDISARVAGMVRDLDDKMDISREVEQGELLLRLDVPDLVADRATKAALWEQARKQEKLSQAMLQVARREVEESQSDEKRFQADASYFKTRHDTARRLVRENAQNPQVELEALRQLESARAAEESNRVKVTKRQAQVESARADLELARQKILAAEGEVKRLDELIKFATVRAPFRGIITRRWVDPGAVIKDSGATLLTLQQIDRVRVLIDVPQRDVPRLNARDYKPNKDGKGDPVTIRMPALSSVSNSNSRGEFYGYVTRVGHSLDPVTRTMRAEIELENPNGELRPGMYGSASVLIENLANVMTLPASCLVRRGEGIVEVYQVTEPSSDGNETRGVLKLIPVSLGIDDSNQVQITGGLKGNELIVLRATGVMRPDETVLAIRSLTGQ